MLFNLLEKLTTDRSITSLSAHCDIPCKIYDPMSAQIAVLTMIRLVDLLDELNQKEQLTVKEQAQFIRLVNEKEEHGIKVKREITIIWGDYFKQPQFEKFPEIHQLTHSIMLAASAAKQHVDRDLTVELLNKVNRFAEVFWATKDVETYQATSPYPPAESVTYPVVK